MANSNSSMSCDLKMLISIYKQGYYSCCRRLYISNCECPSIILVNSLEMKMEESIQGRRVGRPIRDSRSNEGRSKSNSDAQRLRPQAEQFFLTAWGNNTNGEFPASRDRSSWQTLGQGIAALSLGERHSIILNNKSQVFAVGCNAFGQLGLGDLARAMKPQLLADFRDNKIASVSCGPFHTFFLTKRNQLFACGLNLYGNLGLGHCDNVKRPTQISFTDTQRKRGNFFDSSLENERACCLDSDQVITSVACGALHTLLLTSRGRLFSTGHGANYALGNGERANQLTFKEVALEVQGIDQICCGLSHSGVLSNGKVYLWGTIGEKLQYRLPTAIEIYAEVPPSLQNSVTDLRMGDSFAIFLTNAGEVYQLGDELRQEDPNYVLSPRKVALPVASTIECGKRFCYAICQGKTVYGWGSNRFGELTGTLKGHQPRFINMPVLIKSMFTGVDPVRVVCGSFHAMMLSQKQPMLQRFSEQKQNLERNQVDKLKTEHQALKLMNFQLLQKLEKLKLEGQRKKAVQNIRIQTDTVVEERARSPSLAKKNSKFQISGTEKHRTFNSNLEIDFKQLVLQKQISEGGYGIIYRGKWRESTVAVKMFKIENNESAVRDFLSECHAMEALRHPNIVMFLGACTKPPKLCIVLQYCARGSLWSTIQNLDIALTWEDRKRFALDTAKGVHYLHSCQPPILHRDLKSLNLLLDQSFRVKLADFGWTKSLANYMTGKIGTYQWMAPEVIAGEKYTEKADVFSFGIILWEIAAREPPYRNISGHQVSVEVLRDDLRPSIPKKTPEPFMRLIKRCWERDPEKRPSFKEIIRQLQFMRLKQ